MDERTEFCLSITSFVITSSKETGRQAWRMELRWKENQQQMRGRSRPDGQFWASGLLRSEEKGKLFWVSRWPFKLDIECCWRAEVYQCPRPAGYDSSPCWSSRRCARGGARHLPLFNQRPLPFQRVEPWLYKDKRVRGGNKALIHSATRTPAVLPAAFWGLPPFICHEIIKSPLLICGNAAKKKKNSGERNHFDKRFVCAD